MPLFGFGRSLVTTTLVTALFFGGFLSAAATSSPCPSHPGFFEKEHCEPVEKWNYYYLKYRIEFAFEKRIVLCPFTVEKRSNDPPIFIRSKIELVCKEKDKCIIDGGGRHLEIGGDEAEVSISGFVFLDASKTAVNIHKSADEHPHAICDSRFEGNDGSTGVAIRAARKTSLSIVKTTFKNNDSTRGTIYADGKIDIKESTFESNKARKGGAAIYASSSAYLKSTYNTFSNNRGSKFINLKVNNYESRNNQYLNNDGSCGYGVWIRTSDQCIKDTGGFSPPIAPPTTPPNPWWPPITTTTTKPPYIPSVPGVPSPTIPNPMPKGYFNYRAGSQYGPENWDKIPATDTYEYDYWKDLQKYLPADLDENTCDSAKSFNGNRASPVDIRATQDDCKEFHEIRHKPGSFGSLSLDSKYVDLQIRPNLLRVAYDRRKDKLDAHPDVPIVDVPMGWGKFLDVVRVDILCPAEHTMNGQKFDCEIRIYVIQKEGRGVPVITVLAKVGHGNNAHNRHLQRALDEFEKVGRDDEDECRQRNRDLHSSKFNSNINNSTEGRQLTSSGGWDPFEFIEQTGSVWFYGYMGGLPEPPCSFFLHWRVIDTAITISEDQLEQIKEMIYYHRDPETCQYTSNHNEFGSFARPLQDSSRLVIHRCTCREYLPDDTRKRTGLRTCKKNQERYWMPNPYDLKPSAENLVILGGRDEERQ